MLLAYCVGACAETWLVLNGIAQHLDRGSYCNNHLTPGLGIEKDGWAGGFYDNSNCRTSWYAAKYWLPLSVGPIKAGVIAGAVSGYSTSLIPAGGLAATYERKTWGVNLILIPPFSDSSPGVLWGQVKFRW
jgi:hypothetical protein